MTQEVDVVTMPPGELIAKQHARALSEHDSFEAYLDEMRAWYLSSFSDSREAVQAAIMDAVLNKRQWNRQRSSTDS